MPNVPDFEPRTHPARALLLLSSLAGLCGAILAILGGAGWGWAAGIYAGAPVPGLAILMAADALGQSRRRITPAAALPAGPGRTQDA